MTSRTELPATLISNAPLRERTTLRVPAHAAWLAEVQDSKVLPELLRLPQARQGPRLILGEGSNVLFTRDFAGMIIHFATRGIEVVESDRETALVRAAAGESWDGLVRWTLARGLCGLENLILIPGTVGAAPIQNIGAYGTEAGEWVETVEAWDCETDRMLRLSNAECCFAYRDSLFKRFPRRYIVVAVEFRLPRRRAVRLDYSGIRRELQTMGISAPTATQVSRAVERLRRCKLPDPATLGNAGSFFKNPVVAGSHWQTLCCDYPDLPGYPLADGRCKLSAAWLIEACGFRGHREGDAGVSAQHALVLVNHGAATGAQIWALAERIRASVAARFDVLLEPEPLVV